MILGLKVFIITICIYVPTACVTVAADDGDDDLNNEDNDDSVSQLFHSSFWTSKEIKVIIKINWYNTYKRFFVIRVNKQQFPIPES